MIPEPWRVKHRSWQPMLDEFGQVKQDAHGNDRGELGPPIERKARVIRTLRSEEPVAPEYENRTVVDKGIWVGDASLFKPRDVVLIDDVAFDVQADSDDHTKGLFPRYNKLLGEMVHVRRVT